MGDQDRPAESRDVPPPPPEISFVLATLNEVRTLPVLLPEIERACTVPYEIIFVDDGSTDGTRDHIEAWRADHPGTVVLLNPRKQTTLRAHYQGLQAARGRLAVVMDSDLQHPASTIPSILQGLEGGMELVVASRYLPGGSTGNRLPLRGVISRGAAELARLAIPQARTLSDPMSGFFGLQTRLVKPLAKVHRGFKILLLILSMNREVRLMEVPYQFQERREGASKVVQDFGFLRTFVMEMLRDRKLAQSFGADDRRATNKGRDPSGAPGRVSR